MATILLCVFTIQSFTLIQGLSLLDLSPSAMPRQSAFSQGLESMIRAASQQEKDIQINNDHLMHGTMHKMISSMRAIGDTHYQATDYSFNQQHQDHCSKALSHCALHCFLMANFMLFLLAPLMLFTPPNFLRTFACSIYQAHQGYLRAPPTPPPKVL